MNDEEAVFQNESSAASVPCDPLAETAAQNATDLAGSELPPQDHPREGEKADLLFTDPGTDPHSDCQAADPSPEEDRLEQLRGELEELRQQLAQRDAALARMMRTEEDYAEFCALYPDVPVSALSDELWQSVRGGNSLAAAYALQERREALRAQRIAESNRANRARSAGAVHTAEPLEFSPAEVRSMSPAEVRKNLPQIMRSMQKWN